MTPNYQVDELLPTAASMEPRSLNQAVH